MTHPTDPALSPDAPQFAPIDLSQVRRVHPIAGTQIGSRPDPAAADENLPPMEWISWPTQDHIDTAIRETVERIAAFEADPGSPVGPAHSMQTVFVGFARVTIYGALTGMDVIQIPVCMHGMLPPITINDPVTQELVVALAYCDECGIYLPEDLKHSRNPGLDQLLQERG